MGAFSITLPVTTVSASTEMPTPALSPGSVPAGRLRLQVPDDVALHDREPAAFVEIGDRDPDGGAVDAVVGDDRALEAELGIERDLAASLMLLPSIWMLEAALPRTAEKAQWRMRLPRTITLPARNTLMALPYWPEPPERLAMLSMRLSITMVPSSPVSQRKIWMPLLPAPMMVLRAIRRPRAS